MNQRVVATAWLAALVLYLGTGNSALGQADTERAGEKTDKSQFTLVNPTPRELIREMNTDRPDVTESAYTVDAGHLQVELSFVEFTRDDDSDGVRTDAFSVMPSNIKLGLLNNVDLQLVVSPYENVRTEGAGREQGVGNTEVRLKVNLWGNDGGPTAFGVMPFVRVPTGHGELSNDHWEGGFVNLFAMDLPAGFTLGMMGEVDIERDAENKGYGVNVLHTITLGHDIPLMEGLAGYVEYAGITPIDAGSTYLAFVDTGLTYAVSEDVQLDAGMNIGISDRAEDVTFFAGISFRL